MATNPSSERYNIPITHHDNKDLVSSPTEGIVSVGEYDWYAIHVQESRKKRGGKERERDV